MYVKVIAEFDNYFKVENVIYERAPLNQCSQLMDESADHFIMEVHRLAENYEFGKMKDQLIHDCLVVGIRDSALSERLQLEVDLTPNKAKKLCPSERSSKNATRRVTCTYMTSQRCHFS